MMMHESFPYFADMHNFGPHHNPNGYAHDDAVVNEELLHFVKIEIGPKRYYIDVKENRQGRFIKIAEGLMNSQKPKRRILLSIDCAYNLRDKMNEFFEFYSSLGPNAKPESNMILKSFTIAGMNRVYYLDLKENMRGRFLRIMQVRKQQQQDRVPIFIPAQGLVEFRNGLTELLDEFGVCPSPDNVTATPAPTADVNNELPAAQMVKAGDTAFYFDAEPSPRGVIIRVSEVHPRYRSAIVINQKYLGEVTRTLESFTRPHGTSPKDGKVESRGRKQSGGTTGGGRGGSRRQKKQPSSATIETQTDVIGVPISSTEATAPKKKIGVKGVTTGETSTDLKKHSPNRQTQRPKSSKNVPSMFQGEPSSASTGANPKSRRRRPSRKPKQARSGSANGGTSTSTSTSGLHATSSPTTTESSGGAADSVVKKESTGEEDKPRVVSDSPNKYNVTSASSSASTSDAVDGNNGGAATTAAHTEDIKKERVPGNQVDVVEPLQHTSVVVVQPATDDATAAGKDETFATADDSPAAVDIASTAVDDATAAGDVSDAASKPLVLY